LALFVGATVLAIAAQTGAAGFAPTQSSGIFRISLAPQAGLHVYTDDGSFVESGSDASGAARSPQYGRWERVGGRLYAATGSFFRFNPQTRAHVGSMKINRTLRLSDDGQSFTAIARVLTLDLSGNVVSSFLSRSTGERMQVERIAEEP